MNSEDLITYMEYQWILIDDGILTIGINEEGLEQLDEIKSVDLPPDSAEVIPEEVFGEIETESGPMNLYSPVDGKVIEVNEAVVQNPQLILDDNFGDGWLVRIESDNPDQLSELEDNPIENSDDYSENI